jgi:hypothetical protein
VPNYITNIRNGNANLIKSAQCSTECGFTATRRRFAPLLYDRPIWRYPLASAEFCYSRANRGEIADFSLTRQKGG